MTKQPQRQPPRPRPQQRDAPEETTTTVNRPRNLIVMDATTPVDFAFDQYGKPVVLTIHQTADESTWPGGALWDCGWCMAQLLARSSTTTTTTTTSTVMMEPPPPHNSSSSNNAVGKKARKGRHTATHRSIPRHLQLPFSLSTSSKIDTVLELGCGVGLTGLVAAIILRPRIGTILTDLPVVIDNVTQRNLQANGVLVDKRTKSYSLQSGGCSVRAMPLCWGNVDDEATVREALGNKAPDLVRVAMWKMHFTVVYKVRLTTRRSIERLKSLLDPHWRRGLPT
jgi:hypothetical protein